MENILLLLKQVLYIYYLMQFKNNQVKIQALINSGNKINAITKFYTAKLSFKVQLTNISAQKINYYIFKMFEIIIASFEVKDKLKKAQIFQKTLLIANTSMAVILRIHFLIFSNINIWFTKKKLTWRSYTFAKALLITKQIDLLVRKNLLK